MTRAEVVASLEPGESAAYSVGAILHMLEIASWQLCSSLSAGAPASMDDVELVATIDRMVEMARAQHAMTQDAISAAAFEFREEASHDL